MQALIQRAVEGVVLNRANTAQTTKDLKIADPKDFSGKPEDLEDFLNSCKLIFSIKPDIYNSDGKKITYAIGLMKTGNAGLWKKQYVQEYFAAGGILADSWTRFKACLRDAFKDVGRAEDSMRWLSMAKQGGKTIEE
jgi:hypothetical protein